MKTSFTLGYSPYDAPTGFKGIEGIFPFDQVFDHGKDLSKHPLSECDALVLWGGTDIHTDFYNRSVHRRNNCPVMPSQRDWFEWELMREARSLGLPIIGVCRGAQFICAFAGGILVQDCGGHNGGYHTIVTEDGEEFLVTSAHHQMMYPWEVDHHVLAWSTKKLANYYHGLTEEEIKKHTIEPEVVLFPEINALAIQAHPEWMSTEHPFVHWCNQQVIDHLNFNVDQN